MSGPGPEAETADEARRLANAALTADREAFLDAYGKLDEAVAWRIVFLVHVALVHRRFGPRPELFTLAEFAATRTAGLPDVPAWQVEAVLRGALGEPRILEGLDGLDMMAMFGFVIGELLRDLALGEAELAELADLVAAGAEKPDDPA